MHLTVILGTVCGSTDVTRLVQRASSTVSYCTNEQCTTRVSFRGDLKTGFRGNAEEGGESKVVCWSEGRRGVLAYLQLFPGLRCGGCLQTCHSAYLVIHPLPVHPAPPPHFTIAPHSALSPPPLTLPLDHPHTSLGPPTTSRLGWRGDTKETSPGGPVRLAWATGCSHQRCRPRPSQGPTSPRTRPPYMRPAVAPAAAPNSRRLDGAARSCVGSEREQVWAGAGPVGARSGAGCGRCTGDRVISWWAMAATVRQEQNTESG